jgi:hypothetical protein
VQEALESSGSLDDSQWLTYWLLSSFFTIFERFGYRILFKLPFYSEFKLALLAWLALPAFSGASMIYNNARPYLIDFYNTLRSTTDEIRDEAESKGLFGLLMFRLPCRHHIRDCLLVFDSSDVTALHRCSLRHVLMV